MNWIEHINKVFDHRIRLGIMSALMVNESVDFVRLKELLQTSDGNLASHIKALENAEYVLYSKQFIGKKPNTTYRISEQGRTAFELHLKALEELIKQSK
jgi:DNA-binding MarR family transcriptional regulator